MTDPLTEVQERARRMLAQGVRPTPEALASAAGISRSTYFRLVGSHREFLNSLGWDEGATARERLLAAALELIDETGLGGLAMDAVAARAETSRATLYRLFPTKAALFSALASEYAPLKMLRGLLEQAQGRDVTELLVPLLKAAAPRLLERRGLLRAILAEAAIDGPDTAGGRDIVVVAYRALATYLEAQMDAGKLRRANPVAAVQALLGPILFYASVRPDAWVESPSAGAVAGEVINEMIEIWLRGMRPDGD
ncbi:MAG TPA: helix-turn-helix domain-containing protein [Tepidiformaceae bacterium]|nr:helix-turn-helix domain-containing protein [Tepidiformaceae bacterium]